MSSKGVLTISLSEVSLLHVAELEEMGGPMLLVVELLRGSKFDAIVHAHRVLHSHEVVVPRSVLRNLPQQQQQQPSKITISNQARTKQN